MTKLGSAPHRAGALKQRSYTNEITLVPATTRGSTKSYVPAQPAAAKPLVRRISPAEVELFEQQVTHQLPAVVAPQVNAAFQAQEAARETTNGKERAVATVIRMAPMTGIFAILATGLAFALRLSLGQTLVIFAIVTGVTYYRFNRTDYEHSAAGVERHRIDRATELAKAKMGYDNQLRRELAQAYLQHLEQLDHD